MNVLLLFVPVGGRWQDAGRSTARCRVDPESGARGASASSGRESQHLVGPPLETAARREEVGPREGRPAGALRQGAAGVGHQHQGAPSQDGEGVTITDRRARSDQLWIS